MRIGLISDTHVPSVVRSLRREITDALRGVDMIFHAGDIYVPEVLDVLEGIAPVLAALGNGDVGLENDRRILPVHLLEVEGLLIGLTHAFEYPDFLAWGYTFDHMMQRMLGGPVDIVVCGDTHVESIQWHENVLIVNPGSPTAPHNLIDRPGTVGILDIKDGKATAEIVQLRW
ncbi:MAG: metallophosphoesterase family protein [Chloroflexi bacterium]|nr:metallophosphoesterase family protein [Chloroflexota bacterium]